MNDDRDGNRVRLPRKLKRPTCSAVDGGVAEQGNDEGSSKYAPTFLLNTASIFTEKRAAKLADE